MGRERLTCGTGTRLERTTRDERLKERERERRWPWTRMNHE